METITILGAGLVGSLLSIYLARRGYQITVFERNADMRTGRIQAGMSINLTLCKRGLDALDQVGVGDIVRSLGVPVRGRMIHMLDCPVQWQPYGNNGEALLSISRNELNAVLLDYAQSHFPIEFRFGYKCTGVDLSSLDIEFEATAKHTIRHHTSRWIIAADGAFSAMRQQLQKSCGFNYSQEYTSLAYKQLDIPASTGDGWTNDREGLHLWPRGHSMLLAIPNRDGSFTATLLMPLRGVISYASITTGPQIEAFFEAFFPDARDRITALVDDYLMHRAIPMVTIRCSPWSFANRVLLVGDAAHAIYPSYGQGANAGFEDCVVLDNCLDRWGDDLTTAISLFEELRRPNTDAIADLSKQHLIDLCEAIGSLERTLKDRIERKLNRMYAESYIPLYSMVAFTNMPYATAVQIHQDRSVFIDALIKLPAVRENLDAPETEAFIANFMRSAGLLTMRKERV
jgi:kynurenine 3-monooxygenase